MKNLSSLILFFFLLILNSCDQIEPPYIEQNNQKAEKTVLIEKFTGHQCSNCPEASRKLDELKEFYGDNLISIAIHPGETEFTDTDKNYPYDFTTTSGDIIMTDMGGTAFGLPLGTVNRVLGGIPNTRLWLKDDWATQINNLLYDSDGNILEKNIDFEITCSFDDVTKELTVQTNISIINNLEGNYNLCLLITEDGIISPQDDGYETIEYYEHNHIFRCSINNVYGENINDFYFVGLDGQSGYQATHSIILDESANINWTNDWNNINNCSVIAYIYNSESLIIEHTEKTPITY